MELADIEELNESAATAKYELTKVSYGAIPSLMKDYRILRSGGALGRACGPLLISRHGVGTLFMDFADKRIAIPGEHTTAFMLLQLAFGRRPNVVQMRFDRIADAVANGEVDAGLIIHESRFTYREKNLVAIVDLGEWWETHTLAADSARSDSRAKRHRRRAREGDRRRDSSEPGLRARERSGRSCPTFANTPSR